MIVLKLPPYIDCTVIVFLFCVVISGQSCWIYDLLCFNVPINFH